MHAAIAQAEAENAAAEAARRPAPTVAPAPAPPQPDVSLGAFGGKAVSQKIEQAQEKIAGAGKAAARYGSLLTDRARTPTTSEPEVNRRGSRRAPR